MIGQDNVRSCHDGQASHLTKLTSYWSDNHSCVKKHFKPEPTSLEKSHYINMINSKQWTHWKNTCEPLMSNVM